MVTGLEGGYLGVYRNNPIILLRRVGDTSAQEKCESDCQYRLYKFHAHQFKRAPLNENLFFLAAMSIISETGTISMPFAFKWGMAFFNASMVLG